MVRKTVQTGTTITTAAEFVSATAWLVSGGWLQKRLVDNVSARLAAGEVVVVFPEMNAKTETWDGEMVINFTRVPKAQDLVNDFIFRCSADEISMETNKSLRLWWD